MGGLDRPKNYTSQEVLNRVFIVMDDALLTKEYLQSIAQERIEGHFPFHKFGFNGTVSASEEDIWEGSAAYSYLTSATVLKISSSSVNDDAGGTGALTVKLLGVDTNYNEINETITLDGETPVNTTKSYLRIYRMIVITAGGTGSNEGIIYAGTGDVTNGVPAVEYNRISIGWNQSLMALFTIPAGHEGLIESFFASTGIANKTTEIFLYIRPFGEVFQCKQRYHIIAGIVERRFPLPLKVTEKSDIAIRALASGGGGAVSASFDLWYGKI